MAKTVPMLTANPVPFHSMNAAAHVMTIRFAHSSKFPFGDRNRFPGGAHHSFEIPVGL